MPDPIDSWTIRLEGARDALIRSRLAFIAVTIAATAFIIVAFNQTASWERQISTHTVTSDIKKEMQKELGRLYVHDTTISNSLLGITINANDAPVLGSMSLIILTTWFFYSTRRENHLIAYLISDAAHTEDADIIERIFYGITSYLVFITISKDDFPVDSIARARVIKQDDSVAVVRTTYKLSLYLPFIAISFVIITSLISLVLPGVVREDDSMLLTHLHWYEWIEVAVTQLIAFLAAATLLDLCNKIVKFDKATGKILHEFKELARTKKSTT